MTKIQELKACLKEMACELTVRKTDLKISQRANLAEAATLMWSLCWKRADYRNHHIAYCELKGRTRDQIEQPRKGNEPNESAIASVKAKYAEVL